MSVNFRASTHPCADVIFQEGVISAISRRALGQRSGRLPVDGGVNGGGYTREKAGAIAFNGNLRGWLLGRITFFLSETQKNASR